jgi:hypothetical protein
MDWEVSGDVEDALLAADLVLVDSPYFTPFRESTLWSSLQRCPQALIVLDDTRIPTLQRFSQRLASANPDLLYQQIKGGQGLAGGGILWAEGSTHPFVNRFRVCFVCSGS